MRKESKFPGQFIKFGLIGAVNSVMNYFIYAFCISVGMHYVVANVIGFLITILNAYMLQSKFVFPKNRSLVWWRVLIKTYVSYAFTGLFLTNLLSVFWIDIMDLSAVLHPLYAALKGYFNWPDISAFIKYAAPVLNMIVSIPINFFINKHWTYKEK